MEACAGAGRQRPPGWAGLGDRNPTQQQQQKKKKKKKQQQKKKNRQQQECAHLPKPAKAAIPLPPPNSRSSKMGSRMPPKRPACTSAISRKMDLNISSALQAQEPGRSEEGRRRPSGPNWS